MRQNRKMTTKEMTVCMICESLVIVAALVTSASACGRLSCRFPDHCSGCCVDLDTNDWIPLILPWLLKWQEIPVCHFSSQGYFLSGSVSTDVQSLPALRNNSWQHERAYCIHGNLPCRVQAELHCLFDSSTSCLCYCTYLSAIYSNIQLPCLYVNK